VDDAADEQGGKPNPFLGGRGRRHTLTGRWRCLLSSGMIKTATSKDGRSTSDDEPTHGRTPGVRPADSIDDGML
jgi:hypothetical protein